MNIALTGGGTAGHIIPNLALVNNLSKHFENIYYFGDINGMEHSLTQKYNVKFVDSKGIKFKRDKFFQNFKIIYYLPKYIHSSKKALKNSDIDVVFSKGGYISLPICIAAKMLRIPVICHESDLTIGLSNKVTSIFAKKIITSFPNTSKKSNSIYIGNPLRDEIFHTNKNYINTNYMTYGKKVLLIIGGSLGSKTINELIYKSIDILVKHYFVIHICGNNFKKINKAGYVQLSFVDNIFDYISSADYIISRCGANIAQEITALNKKVIYIPLSKKASRGDQILNAEYFTKNNLSLLLYEEDLNIRNLMSKLQELEFFVKTPYYYDAQIPTKITNLILGTIKK